ncbi:hypothetical protein RFI_01855 [Reticulomyxa filosa]|uniref:Uncharacterized protein n=1 Tax=Reticulomyxa filosa TaxID=46433 RepID=X6P9K1_RETFI|nr:hypothetical protein RFI_01855 [Reticulomyxa filosa]|eukprot:ETO35220.1 hypothetical protein RFI_01855 [Reticulomyxa filosa]
MSMSWEKIIQEQKEATLPSTPDATKGQQYKRKINKNNNKGRSYSLTLENNSINTNANTTNENKKKIALPNFRQIFCDDVEHQALRKTMRRANTKMALPHHRKHNGKRVSVSKYPSNAPVVTKFEGSDEKVVVFVSPPSSQSQKLISVQSPFSMTKTNIAPTCDNDVQGKETLDTVSTRMSEDAYRLQYLNSNAFLSTGEDLFLTDDENDNSGQHASRLPTGSPLVRKTSINVEPLRRRNSEEQRRVSLIDRIEYGLIEGIDSNSKDDLKSEETSNGLSSEISSKTSSRNYYYHKKYGLLEETAPACLENEPKHRNDNETVITQPTQWQKYHEMSNSHLLSLFVCLRKNGVTLSLCGWEKILQLSKYSVNILAFVKLWSHMYVKL